MVFVTRRFGRGIAATLFGDDMQQHGTKVIRVAQVAQDLDQLRHVMPIDRADIVEAEFLEQGAAGDDAARIFVGLLRRALQPVGQAPCHLGGKVTQAEELARGHQPRQVARHRADGGGDRHFVVVEDDDQPFRARSAMRGVVHRLIRHACGDGAIADHRDDVAFAIGRVVFGAQVVRHRHAQPGGNGGGGMRRAERVIFAFAAAGEARQAARLAQGADAVAPPGQDLVRIGLVADIPDHAVIGRVEHGMQRNRQFHNPKRRAKVPAGGRHRVDRLRPQFVRKRPELLHRKVAHVMRVTHTVKLRKTAQRRDRSPRVRPGVRLGARLGGDL